MKSKNDGKIYKLEERVEVVEFSGSSKDSKIEDL
jgi:hypothetical protein